MIRSGAGAGMRKTAGARGPTLAQVAADIIAERERKEIDAIFVGVAAGAIMLGLTPSSVFDDLKNAGTTIRPLAILGLIAAARPLLMALAPKKKRGKSKKAQELNRVAFELVEFCEKVWGRENASAGAVYRALRQIYGEWGSSPHSRRWKRTDWPEAYVKLATGTQDAFLGHYKRGGKGG